MSGKTFFVLGSIFGFLGVAIGAFGAHGLKTRLAPEMLAIFEIGARYQMYHALALLAVAWAMSQSSQNLFPLSGWLFVFGIIVFSGSLYVLALTGVKVWGAITPAGGMLLLLGWLVLVLAAFKT